MGDRRGVIACLGAGRMGRGIAHAFAYAGHQVRLVDVKTREPAAFERLAGEARTEVEASLSMLAGLGLFGAEHITAILARISVHPRDAAGSALTDVPYVFEGVPETEEAKREAFAFADEHLGETAIFASTTSTFLSTRLAGYTRRPARFLNAHWLNPAYLVPLVEVSPHDGTDSALTNELCDLLRGIGKEPVLCRAAPGYIVPRIQALAMNEAARMVEEGVATAADIDRAVRYGFGFRFAVLGLLEFIDWGGGDILYYASRSLQGATGEARFAAPKIVEDNMAQGRIGMRTGSGFYDWQDKDVNEHRRRRLGEFVTMLKNLGATRPPVI